MIRWTLPMLPPSTNHAYITVMKKQGRKSIPMRVLSPAGRRFKKEATAFILKAYGMDLAHLKENVTYGLAIELTFEELTNKTWSPDGKGAKNRYKKVDASNRIKLIEDVLVDVSGIDDSQFMTLVVKKQEGDSPSTRLWIWDQSLRPDVMDSIQDGVGIFRSM